MKVKKVKSPSRVQLFVTLWTVVYQAPPSMGFFRQEYWSGFPFLSPGDLPDPGIGPGSPTLQTDASPSEPPGINDEHLVSDAYWPLNTGNAYETATALCGCQGQGRQVVDTGMLRLEPDLTAAVSLSSLAYGCQPNKLL